MDLNYDLDVFGQQPGLSNLYTQISSCFSVPDTSSHLAIIKTLTNGLERLSASFPWVAGQVINEGGGEDKPGIFKIVPLESIPRLVVKDLRNDPSAPTMDDFRRADFPFNMLDESIIAPRNTLSGSPDGSPSPVFLLQATFTIGGLLLTFVGQHNVMDMTGQGQIIDLLSKACRNEPFTSEELSVGNIDRRNVVPLLDDSYEPGSELAHQIIKPPPSQAVSNDADAHITPLPPPKCSWAYFTFSHTSLAALKSLATKNTTLTSGYVSTDDTLSAFIWQSIIRARLPRLDPTTEVTFARAIDPRRHLGIPPTYAGIVQNMTYNRSPAQKLVKEQLGTVASQLRLAVDPKTSNLAYQTRALATVLHRTPGSASVTATLDLSADIMLSSWAKQDFYDLDFNLGLGKPEAVRRPRFPPVESLLYLMPKALDGGIAAALCLRDEDMERLKADEEFAKYGSYIG